MLLAPLLLLLAFVVRANVVGEHRFRAPFNRPLAWVLFWAVAHSSLPFLPLAEASLRVWPTKPVDPFQALVRQVVAFMRPVVVLASSLLPGPCGNEVHHLALVAQEEQSKLRGLLVALLPTVVLLLLLVVGRS